MMKRLMPLVLLILLFGCQDDGFDGIDVSDDSSITSLNGTWKVIAYEDYEQDKLITKTEENSWGKDVIITFDDTTNPPRLVEVTRVIAYLVALNMPDNAQSEFPF